MFLHKEGISKLDCIYLYTGKWLEKSIPIVEKKLVPFQMFPHLKRKENSYTTN